MRRICFACLISILILILDADDKREKKRYKRTNEICSLMKTCQCSHLIVAKFNKNDLHKFCYNYDWHCIVELVFSFNVVPLYV